jgi:hypothetical protein
MLGRDLDGAIVLPPQAPHAPHAALNNAPIDTFDVDVVHSLEPANIDHVLDALQALDAFFRMPQERRLHPTASHIAAGSHLNLMTRFGALDLLGTIGKDLGYPELLPNSTEMDIGGGLRVRVLNMETIIATKEYVASEKDLAVLPILRRTLIEIRRESAPLNS